MSLCFFLARRPQKLAQDVKRVTLRLAHLCLRVDEVLDGSYQFTLRSIECLSCVLELRLIVFVHRSPGLIRGSETIHHKGALLRDVSAVRLIGNALTATALRNRVIRNLYPLFAGPPLSRVRESISNHQSCGDLPPMGCMVGIKFTTVSFAANCRQSLTSSESNLVSRRSAASQLHGR